MKYLYSSIIIVLILTTKINAQSWSESAYSYATDKLSFKAKRVVPGSPDAASLGTYGNIPVNLFTGTPQVGIPIYEIQGNRLSAPISLSYNAGGFKPQDVASWVGLGWTLNAGGVITRSVMGNPDNANNYFNTVNHYTAPPPMNEVFKTYDLYDSIRNGYYESQPDIYYYNFNGHSGKFFLKQDLSVVTKEKNNLKITSSGVQNPNDVTGNSSFTITDEQGNVYVFSATEVSFMQLDDGMVSGQPAAMNYYYPSSWYLTSITSADAREQILFNYYTADSSQNQFTNYVANSSYTYNKSSLNLTQFNYTFLSNNISNPPTVSITKRRYLQSISYTKAGGTVQTINFDLAVDQRSDLNHADNPCERIPYDIKVYAGSSLIKQVNFYYGYFTNSSFNNYDHKRLRLDSIKEIPTDVNTPAKPPYVFTYRTGNIPSQAQGSIDHWGFSNGGDVSASGNLIPYYTPGNGDNTLYGGGANREPDSTSSALTTLTQIKYPTGGSSVFEYEQHQAKDAASGLLRYAGGLRIKKISDYSFNGKLASLKTYQYQLADGSSSGKVETPVYYSYSGFHHYPEPCYSCGSNDPRLQDYTISYLSVSGSSAAGLGTVQGSHVGYSVVTEYQTDPSNNISLGKTVYKFQLGNIDPDNDDISNGDLLQKTVYDIGGKVIEDELNNYTYTNPGPSASVVKVATTTIQDNNTHLCQYNSGGSIMYTWIQPSSAVPTCIAARDYSSKFFSYGYVMFDQYKQLSSKVKTVYDQASNSYATTTTTFSYGNPGHTYPTQIEETSSNNDKIVTTKKYAGDYTVPGSGTLDNATTAIQLLQTKNMIGEEIEMQQYRQNQDGTNKRYLDGMLSFYDPSSPYLMNTYRLETSAPLTTVNVSTTNGTFTYDANYKPLGVFTYDAYGNLKEQSKSQDIVKAYVWDYNAVFPTAEATNASGADIAYTSFETGTNGGNWSVAGLVGNMVSGGMAGNNGFIVGGSSNITKSGLSSSKNYIVSYWSKGGALTITTNSGSAVGVSGLVYNGWTYYEHALPASTANITISGATITIDELRLHPADAQMGTYVYKPFVGVSSIGASGGQMLFYEYDGFNRLINIKDMQGNIVKNYKYNYGLGASLSPSVQTMFYSAPAQGNYTKNNGCPAGTEPTTVTYLVPYGKYVSSISQTDANAKATADVSANGQNNANTYGQCLYWNVKDSAYYSKNDCLYEQGVSMCSNSGQINQRTRILYKVPAHTYSSLISQADADAKAHNDVLTNGQNYANTNCWCSCTAQGQKYINGTCETGTRFNSSTTYMANGTWQCVFFYQFSDGSVSPFYTEYNASPCPIQ